MKGRSWRLWLACLAVCAWGLTGCGDSGKEESAQAEQKEEAAEDSVPEKDFVPEEETVSEEAPEAETAQEEEPAQETAPQMLITGNTKDWYDEENGNWLLHLEYADVEVQGEGFEAASESVAGWSRQLTEELLAYGEELAQMAGETADMSGRDLSDSYYYSLFEEPEVRRADGRVVSLLVFHSQYTGGAHDIYGYNGFTFDARTGEQLELGDILTDEETFRREATAYIIEELKRQYGEGLFPDYEDTVEEMWEREPTWVLDASGITFMFDPYAVGPFAMGPAEVTLPYELFGTYMIKDIWAE